MVEDQEQGHACRLCKKHFPCGRSLGGHMKSHLRSSNTSTATNVSNGGSSSNTNTNHDTYLVDFEAGGHVGYGLRENPKKTWRLADSIDEGLKHEKYCKECGKGFQSSQALSGHMRSHSEKGRVWDSVEDHSWVDGNRKLIMDSQSETEAKAPRRRRRSRRSRYKNTTSVTVTAAFTCVSEIEQEQEEIAKCLMMLSRDVRYWGGLNSVGESSDNNSAVAEVSSSGLVKMTSDNVDRGVKVKSINDKKLDCVQLGLKGPDSSFGYLTNRFDKLESAVTVVRSAEECRFMKPKCEEDDGLEKGFTKEAEFQTDSVCWKYNSGKRSRPKSNISRMLEECLPKKLKRGVMDSLSKYECAACNKTFHSFQALGGHRASHNNNKTKGCSVSKTESFETSDEITASRDSGNDSSLMKSCGTEGPIRREGTKAIRASLKKNRHQCGICFRVFASGQALGGHKRCHVVGSSEAKARGNQQTAIVPRELPVIRDFLDLNLPATVEEETNVSIGMKPWWVVNNHKHEQAVGLN